MAADTNTLAETIGMKALTKREIDRRIQDLIKEVTPAEAAEEIDPDACLRPRPIDTAEFVRRVRPFLAYN